MSPAARGGARVVIRPLEQGDLQEADRVTRLAFGTFLGVPDPVTVFGDAEMVRTRFAAEPSWAFAAELDGQIVGSNFATRWGSFGFFGPLSVRPDLWDQGIAQQLMAPVVDLFDAWPVRQAGLFTFAESPKHVGLYQRLGFWPQHLTAVMARPVGTPAAAGTAMRYSEVPAGERDATLERCRELTGAVFGGLDLEHEIRAADAQASVTRCCWSRAPRSSGSPSPTAGPVRPGVAAASSSSAPWPRGRRRANDSSGVTRRRGRIYQRLLA